MAEIAVKKVLRNYRESDTLLKAQLKTCSIWKSMYDCQVNFPRFLKEGE